MSNPVTDGVCENLGGPMLSGLWELCPCPEELPAISTVVIRGTFPLAGPTGSCFYSLVSTWDCPSSL